MEFKIEREPYGEGVKLYKKEILELNPNSISCFVGCNGSGKTTLINEIKYNLRKLNAKEIKADFYFNALGGIFNDLRKEKKEYGNIVYLDFNKHTDTSFRENDYFINAGLNATSSTGEAVINRFGRHLQVIGTIVRNIKNQTIFMFLDDCDAGTSIDMIQDIKDCFQLITNDCMKNNNTFYIVLTANSFEFCKDLDCISIHDFKHKQFKTYSQFKKFVLSSRKIKDKRYGKTEE